MFEAGSALDMYYCNLGMDTANSPDTSAATVVFFVELRQHEFILLIRCSGAS